jgi:hypothetical protein
MRMFCWRLRLERKDDIKLGWEGVGWINLTQYRALVNTVTNLQFYKRRGIS